MLIGRDHEIAALEAQLDGATRGRSAALLGFGEPGIGKSALAARAVDLALDRGMRVLRARGVEAETDIPFAALSELLAPILDQRHRLPPVQAEALGAALALEPAAGAHDRFAVAAALLSLLAAAADEQPLLAVIDDAQWVDDASLDSLLFAARRLENEGVVMLLGTRPEPDRGLVGRGMFEFELQPLGDQDARRLLDRAAAEPLADDAADRLLRSAAGNPLALLELPGTPRADTAGTPGPPAPGARVEAAFRATLAQLPPATREALTVVAADEASAPVTVAAALEELGLPPDALAAAESARVIQVTRGQLQFRHPLLRSVAYHQAGAEQRRRVHAALAVATGHDADPVARAWHLAAAATGRDRRVADELEGAAASARARGAVTSAAHALSAVGRADARPHRPRPPAPGRRSRLGLHRAARPERRAGRTGAGAHRRAAAAGRPPAGAGRGDDPHGPVRRRARPADGGRRAGRPAGPAPRGRDVPGRQRAPPGVWQLRADAP